MHFAGKRVQHLHEIERGEKKRCDISNIIISNTTSTLKSRINYGQCIPSQDGEISKLFLSASDV
jgi:hypothetical protein